MPTEELYRLRPSGVDALAARIGSMLDRFLPASTQVAHKAGWIATSRGDNGIVYWPGGAFVAAVTTWSPRGVGTASDILAGRVARIALSRFQRRG